MPKLRKTFTVKVKCRVLKYMEDNQITARECAREFGLHHSMVSRWKQNSEMLKDLLKTKAANQRKLHPGGAVFSEQLDADLLEYLIEQRAVGLAVTNNDLKRKAQELARQMGIEENNFHASDGFIGGWKNRHSIAMRRRTTEVQKFPQEMHEQMVDFRKQIRDVREQRAIDLDGIVNMDQTMVWFDMPQRYTNNVRFPASENYWQHEKGFHCSSKFYL